MSAQAAVIWEIASLAITAAQVGLKEDEIVTRAKARAGENPTPEQIRDALRAVREEARNKALDATRE